MAHKNPLNILILEGGGLQAISTLFILRDVLGAIAKQNGVTKLRPCDVFDTITGIGAGGWLALLLGRFQMDITVCLSAWYDIMWSIPPRSKSKELLLRVLQHSYFENNNLVDHIENLAEKCQVGERLFDFDHKGARTRHVFVAALDADSERYSIFRTYDAAKSAEYPSKLLGGPQHPEDFRISHAFAVTGASRYFTPPWEVHMEQKGRMRFTDHKFPERHNIAEITLDEMRAIYGDRVPLSVIVNIGPGLPGASDLKKIARRFSWSLNPVGYHSGSDASVRTQEPEEHEIERSIGDKLRSLNPDAENVYFRLALPEATPGSTLNDSWASAAVTADTKKYLEQPKVKEMILDAAKRAKVNMTSAVTIGPTTKDK